MAKTVIHGLFTDIDPAAPGQEAPVPGLGRQIALLSQMVEEISGELALEPLLNRIVERACKLIGADDGVIGLYAPELDAIRTAASYNIPVEQVNAVLPRGHGLTGRVLELDAPLRCRYGDLPHPTRIAAMDMDMIGMPIRSRGEIVGVFGIGVWPPGQFDDAAPALLEQFSRHAAVAIDNARRYALEQRRTTRFALIVRVAGIIAADPDINEVLQRAADVIHELLQYPNVNISLIDTEDQGALAKHIRSGEFKRLIHGDSQRVPIESSIMGAAVRERRSQLVNDVSRDPRYVTPPGITPPGAELAVPILFGDEVLGVLNVEGEHAFDELDKQSLEVIAEHLALAIQASRLFDRSRQLVLFEERQRLARELHDNITQILSSISMISQSLEDAWLKNPAEGVQRAARLSELAQMAFSELRELLKELSPSLALRSGHTGRIRQVPVGVVQLHQDGLAATAERLIGAMTPAQMTHSTDFTAFHPQSLEHEEALLRICQEATSNAIRHSGAACLSVEAGTDDNQVWLRVSDDGHGVSDNTPAGMGIANMWQRMLILGGSLSVAARRPHGTCIEARLPRQDRES